MFAYFTRRACSGLLVLSPSSFMLCFGHCLLLLFLRGVKFFGLLPYSGTVSYWHGVMLCLTLVLRSRSQAWDFLPHLHPHPLVCISRVSCAMLVCVQIRCIFVALQISGCSYLHGVPARVQQCAQIPVVSNVSCTSQCLVPLALVV